MADDELENQSGGSFLKDTDQQRQHKELIDRLKKEGQLTRNSGSNSLKSIKLEVGKFDDALSAMRSKLKDQTVVINDLLGVQKNALELEESEIQRLKKKDQLESVQKTVSGREEDDRREDDRRDARPGTPTPEPGAMSGFFRRIGPGLGGFLGAAFGGMTVAGIASRFGGLLLRAIPVVTLAPMIGEFIGDFAKASLSDFLGRNLEEGEELSEARNEFIDSFSSSAGRVAIWTAIGAIFGRRAAAIFGAAGIASEATSSAIEDILEKTGFSEDDIVEAFGKEWDSEKVSKGIGATVGGITAAALMSRGLWRRVGIPGLVITAVLAFSEPLKGWLEEQGLPEGFADMAVNVAGAGLTGWTLARMFIGRAGLPGAVIGIGLALGSTLYKWYQKRRAEAVQQVYNELEKVDPLDLSEDIRQDGAATSVRGLGAMSGPEAASAVADALSSLEINELLEAIKESPEDVTHRIALSEIILDISDEVREGVLEPQIANEIVMQISATIGDILQYNGIAQDTREDFEDNILEPLSQIDIPEFEYGSKGFQDFGSGSLAMLHGIEAVVPRQTPAGEMLATAFDENFEPRFEVNAERMNPVLEQIATSAQTMTSNIVFAPTTNAPVTSIQQGGSTVSSVTQNSVTSFGGGDGGTGLGRFAN